MNSVFFTLAVSSQCWPQSEWHTLHDSNIPTEVMCILHIFPNLAMIWGGGESCINASFLLAASLWLRKQFLGDLACFCFHSWFVDFPIFDFQLPTSPRGLLSGFPKTSAVLQGLPHTSLFCSCSCLVLQDGIWLLMVPWVWFYTQLETAQSIVIYPFMLASLTISGKTRTVFYCAWWSFLYHSEVLYFPSQSLHSGCFCR